MRHVCPDCGDTGERAVCPSDGTMRIPAGADPLLGTVIGSWRVARLLGAGGMGRVYLAVQPAIGARVAIKVLKREAAADADLVDRFFNEARAVNVIRHESIVDIIDLGRLPDGSPYIVMEHLDGASLGALFRRHRLFPLGTLARLVGEVLAALAAAHAKAIIHRDLKPDNVFVSPAGRVTVLDFGIAKLATVDGVTTQTGSLLGTPAYMAPEQARSQPLDARADLYAAGVILYEGATGGLPFTATSLYELLDLQVKAVPAAPRSKNPAIPEPLEAVILRALAKDPNDRFATAAAMRDALLAAVAELPATAFAEISTAAAILPGPTSDPFAPTAATQGSLARGETMPSEPTPPPTAEPRQRGLSRGTVGGLAAIAVLGAGAAAFVALRKPEERAVAKPVAMAIDARTVVADAAVTIEAAPADTYVAADAAAAVPHARPRVAIDAAEVKPPEPVNGEYMLAVKNPSSVDVAGLVADAARYGERLTGGTVVLFGLNLHGFDRTGHIDIHGGEKGTIHFTAVARYNAKQPCVLAFTVGGGRVVMTIPNECTPGPRFQMRCTLPQLWQRALELGLPADAQLGGINRLPGGAYQFTMGSDFSVRIEDDC